MASSPSRNGKTDVVQSMPLFINKQLIPYCDNFEMWRFLGQHVVVNIPKLAAKIIYGAGLTEDMYRQQKSTFVDLAYLAIAYYQAVHYRLKVTSYFKSASKSVGLEYNFTVTSIAEFLARMEHGIHVLKMPKGKEVVDCPVQFSDIVHDIKREIFQEYWDKQRALDVKYGFINPETEPVTPRPSPPEPQRTPPAKPEGRKKTAKTPSSHSSSSDSSFIPGNQEGVPSTEDTTSPVVRAPLWQQPTIASFYTNPHFAIHCNVPRVEPAIQMMQAVLQNQGYNGGGATPYDTYGEQKPFAIVKPVSPEDSITDVVHTLFLTFERLQNARVAMIYNQLFRHRGLFWPEGLDLPQSVLASTGHIMKIGDKVINDMLPGDIVQWIKENPFVHLFADRHTYNDNRTVSVVKCLVVEVQTRSSGAFYFPPLQDPRLISTLAEHAQKLRENLHECTEEQDCTRVQLEQSYKSTRQLIQLLLRITLDARTEEESLTRLLMGINHVPGHVARMIPLCVVSFRDIRLDLDPRLGYIMGSGELLAMRSAMSPDCKSTVSILHTKRQVLRTLVRGLFYEGDHGVDTYRWPIDKRAFPDKDGFNYSRRKQMAIEDLESLTSNFVLTHEREENRASHMMCAYMHCFLLVNLPDIARHEIGKFKNCVVVPPQFGSLFYLETMLRVFFEEQHEDDDIGFSNHGRNPFDVNKCVTIVGKMMEATIVPGNSDPGLMDEDGVVKIIKNELLPMFQELSLRNFWMAWLVQVFTITYIAQLFGCMQSRLSRDSGDYAQGIYKLHRHFVDWPKVSTHDFKIFTYKPVARLTRFLVGNHSLASVVQDEAVTDAFIFLLNKNEGRFHLVGKRGKLQPALSVYDPENFCYPFADVVPPDDVAVMQRAIMPPPGPSIMTGAPQQPTSSAPSDQDSTGSTRPAQQAATAVKVVRKKAKKKRDKTPVRPVQAVKSEPSEVPEAAPQLAELTTVQPMDREDIEAIIASEAERDYDPYTSSALSSEFEDQTCPN